MEIVCGLIVNTGWIAFQDMEFAAKKQDEMTEDMRPLLMEEGTTGVVEGHQSNSN